MAFDHITNEKRQLTRHIMKHMLHTHSGNQHGGILLTGASGIGKTQFVHTFADMLGMDVITIETPHIVEEHLINIPFVVFSSTNHQTTTGRTVLKQDDYQLVLADSHLFQQMQHTNKVPDDKYLEHIRTKASPAARDMFVSLGGHDGSIPPAITSIRQRFDNLLFIDEFLRETTVRIRNILRDLLNGNIGMHQIPASTYLIYATNINDTGVDDVPQNYQFAERKFPSPKKDDWFAWLVSKYAKHHSIRLNPQIIKHFQQALTDADISFDDAMSDVRTSPRRWEQIILYLNSSFPIRDEQSAVALMTNIRNNFVHHETEQHSTLAEKVTQALSELIKQLSGFDIPSNIALQPEEWRVALGHSVEQMMANGSARRHIPVLSGPPGIGKTKFAAQVAAENNLHLIDIDVGGLFADDIVGNPLPANKYDHDENGFAHKIRVKFSMPKLAKLIAGRIRDADSKFEQHVKQTDPANAEQRIAEFKNQRWKYLIFFDELNRCDLRTINSLRRVILERNFGPADEGDTVLELPKSALVIGAWNPDPNTGGTTAITKHFADVTDIIPAHAGWTKLKNFLSHKHFEGVSSEITQPAMALLQEFADVFAVKDPDLLADRFPGKKSREQLPFYPDINGMVMYLSAREYTDLYSALVRSLTLCDEDLNDGDYHDASKEERRALIDHYVKEAFDESLSLPERKSGIDPDAAMHEMGNWLDGLPDSIYGGLLSRNVAVSTHLHDDIGRFLDGEDVTKMIDNDTIINNYNLKDRTEIVDSMTKLLEERLVDDESIHKYMIDAVHPSVVRDGDGLSLDSSNKTTLACNFMKALLYTLSIYGFQHDQLSATASALSAAVSNTCKSIRTLGRISADVKTDLVVAASELRSDLQDIIEDDA